MKVVHLTTVATSLRFVEGHIRFLRERQIEVHTISSSSPELPEFAQRNDVISHSVEIQRQISPWRDLRSLWQLVRRLRAIRPQIVHAHTPKAGLLGMIAATLARVPVRIYHIHGLPLMTAYGIKRRLLRMTDRLACRLAHKVYCVSESLLEAVAQKGIVPASQLAVLEKGSIGGIDALGNFNPERFAADESAQIRVRLGIPRDAKVIGFVGRIVRDKGIHELLEAWQQLHSEFNDLHLLIVGPEESADAVSPSVRDLLRNDPQIHCVGFQEETAPYFLAMDVLAFPTYREGFGLVATEAAAMERSVVATKIPGCIDAVDENVTGLLVPAQDARALASALQRYLHDTDLARRHGQAGRRRVLQYFQPQRIQQALWRGYLECLQEKGLPLPESTQRPAKAA